MGFVNQEITFDVDFRQRRAMRDGQLVSDAQAGSSTAFAEIQDIYRRRLYNTIVAITRNREDAEDALQDTFLRAYLALHRFEGRSSVYSWLTRIAVNSALMILRKRRSAAEVFFDSPSEEGNGNPRLEIRDSAPNPEQLFDHHQRTIGLMRAIQKLEPNLRRPIQIQLAQECSLEEIARTLDISVAAVKARLHRARRRLITRRAARPCGATVTAGA